MVYSPTDFAWGFEICCHNGPVMEGRGRHWASPQTLVDKLTWLGSLCNLDLQLIGIHHELRGDTEPSGRNLLDPGGYGVSLLETLQVREGGRQPVLVYIGQSLPPQGIFSALAGIAFPCKSKDKVIKLPQTCQSSEVIIHCPTILGAPNIPL